MDMKAVVTFKLRDITPNGEVITGERVAIFNTDAPLERINKMLNRIYEDGWDVTEIKINFANE